MSKGPKLNHEQQLLLCAPVTDQEIAEGLKAIGNDKSLGLDGYNSHVLYKIISKILASRLQEVIASVVCEAQTGFIPGRKISDNIFLAQELMIYCYFLGGDVEFVATLNRCFMEFSDAPGLQANKEKNSIYFGGVAQGVQDQILKFLGFLKGELPFKYLVIPLATKKISLMQWQPLINKMVSRITSWTAKKLSYAGRSQLIQTVLFGIQAYWSQLFVIPSKVLSTIEAYCRSYLWSGTNTITRKALVAWEKVCTPKSMGGLGLINMRLWNKAAIAKASWDIERKADRLWIRWLHAYYIKNQQFGQMVTPLQAGWMVRKMFEARSTLALIQNNTAGNLIKQIYLQLIGNNERIPWKTLRFGNDARPKAQFTVWLQVHGKLLTVDRIASWGINVDHVCNLCNSHNETRNHLFMECPYSTKVWEGVLKWMKVPSFKITQWEQLKKWIIQGAKGKSQRAQVFKMAYTEWVHTIWIERNQRRFESRSRSSNQPVKVRPHVIPDHDTKLDGQARDSVTDRDRDQPRARPSGKEIEQDRGKHVEPNNGKPRYPRLGEDHGANLATYQGEADLSVDHGISYRIILGVGLPYYIKGS
ncbi:PREDICTED: uncharacterized protein LOC109215147 [Nicotiana attenuata]|uniref:uncharacterized protein LOC109215147 n=1 Tax=Nicotiana attenuata TaxID=49451 RepID=UPI000905BF54|nr:PREDICTED: uncharacterized protein LOC109215147 [Nicotiana attenuata]